MSLELIRSIIVYMILGGRGTLKTVNIKVEAKVRDNEINVYKTNNDLAFKIKFDTTNNKFILTDEVILLMIFLQKLIKLQMK